MSAARDFKWVGLLLLAGCASAPLRASPRSATLPEPVKKPVASAPVASREAPKKPAVPTAPEAKKTPPPKPSSTAAKKSAPKQESPEQLLADGLSELRKGDLQGAAERFDRLLGHSDLSATLRRAAELDAGIVALRRADWALASSHFQAVLKRDPKSFEAALAEVEIARRRKRYPAAESGAKALLSGQGPKARVWEELALIYSDEGKPALAEQVNALARRLAPKDAGIWVDLAVIELREGDVGAATAHLRQALALDPKCVAAYLDLGAIALRHRDAAGAKRAFDRALALEPESPTVRHAHGLVSAAGPKPSGGKP